MAKKRALAQDDNLKYIFYLTLPLLFLPVFFRGLFFSYEADFAHAYTAIVLGIYAYIRKDDLRLSRNIMDYAWLGLIAAYILSYFVAVNPRVALESALAIFNFFIIYWLLAQTVNREKQFMTVLEVMYIAGFFVALAGLGTAFGTFWFNGAFDDSLILSTLQYHNALAIYLVACSIIGFYLTASLPDIKQRVICGAANYIILATAFGAGSRGAMLVAPVGFILLLAGMPKQYRFKVFLNMLAVLIPFFVTAKQVLTFGVNSQAYHWIWLLTGLIIGGASQIVVEKFLKLAAAARRRVIAGAGIAVVMSAVSMILFMGSKIMPTSIADRLSYVSLQDVNVLHRFYYYKDALKIIKDYPVFGTGGGGWETMYPRYQNFLYYTTEVHNHPLRVWVETGTLGILFYVTIWAGLLYTLFRIIKKVDSPEYRAIAWTSAIAAISISLHSLIDFSLSLGAVSILMWGLIGLVRAVERVGSDKGKGKATDKSKGKGELAGTIAGPEVRRYTVLAVAAVYLIISGSLFIGATKEKEAIAAYNSRNIQGAADAFESAVTFDPLNQKYYTYLAQIYNNMSYMRKDPTLAKTAIQHAKKAADLNHTAKPLIVLAQSYLIAGMPGEAVNIAEEAVRQAPWRQDSYDNLANVYMNAAQIYLRQGQKQPAKDILQQVVDLPARIDTKLSSGVEQRNLWFRGVLNVSDIIKKAVAQAQDARKRI